MKVQVLVLTTYDDTFPTVNFVNVEGDKLNDDVLSECLEKGMNGVDTEEDPVDFLNNHVRMEWNDNRDCVCIWGEELQIILTVVG